MGIIVAIVVIILICKLPEWRANVRYNNCDTSNINVGKMIEDKYNNKLSNAQVKNNIANGKYHRK